MRSSVLIFVAIQLLFGSSSFANEICDSLRQLSDENTLTRIRNCEDIVSKNRFKNPDALKYALQFFSNNYRRLADPSCALQPAADTQCGLCSRPEQIRQGIQNGCTMVINDIESDYPGMPNRGTGNFIDLCARNPKDNFDSFYVNRGTGHNSSATRYDDIPDHKSTILGAFLTDTRVQNFSPYSKPQNYRGLCGNTQPKQVRLLGLNSTNNETDASKPWHYSPYNSSWGCPSVNCTELKYLKNLADNGPSLILNYAKSKMESASLQVRTGQTCMNGSNEGASPVGAPRSSNPAAQ